jgi:DNA-binding response OmpR family regulator
VLRIDRLEIDTHIRRVLCVGKLLILTPQEYILLEALARHEGRTLSRDFILSNFWLNEDTFSNSVDVHILQLRKKIDSGHDVKLIHTVHRIGYMLKRPDTEAA